MIDHAQVTRAQKDFLRAFRQNPAGPAPADWPAPGVLRRWLKNRRFKNALSSVRDAIRFQTDFHLAAAASTAARAIQSTIDPAATAAIDPNADPAAFAELSKTLRSLTDLLRLAHLRERFTTPSRPAPRRHAHPSETASTISVYQEILEDPHRLMSYLCLAARDGTDFDPFLAGFPEELATVRANRDRHQPTPDPTTPT